MKFCSRRVEKQFTQNVYSLVITYRQCLRFHKHSFIFMITDDRPLVKEVKKYLDYSISHLIDVYPWLDGSQLVSYEVNLVPPTRYKIARATDSCSAFLHETISITPYDACVCDFCTFDDNNDYFF